MDFPSVASMGEIIPLKIKIRNMQGVSGTSFYGVGGSAERLVVKVELHALFLVTGYTNATIEVHLSSFISIINFYYIVV
jgi:hypothetical protein